MTNWTRSSSEMSLSGAAGRHDGKRLFSFKWADRSLENEPNARWRQIVTDRRATAVVSRRARVCYPVLRTGGPK
jgi:hypothetical protein